MAEGSILGLKALKPLISWKYLFKLILFTKIGSKIERAEWLYNDTYIKLSEKALLRRDDNYDFSRE